VALPPKHPLNHSLERLLGLDGIGVDCRTRVGLYRAEGNINMQMNFTYTDLSFIREVVTAHRTREVQEFAYLIRHAEPFEAVQAEVKAYEEETNPFCPVGMCNNILRKIQVVEDEIKQAMENSGVPYEVPSTR